MPLSPSDLYVVLPISNPLLWTSRVRLANDMVQHLLDSGVNVIIVECAFGERHHQLAHWNEVPGPTASSKCVHVPVHADTMVWTKENLTNLGFARAPDHANYLGWFDADIRFRNPNWAIDTLNMLQLYDVVQPWTDCYDLGPKGEHMHLHRSFANIWIEGKPIMQGPSTFNAPYQFAHPGYAWAARRSMLNTVGGLIETAALGAADHHMAMALIGRVKDSIPGNINKSYSRPLIRWQERAAMFNLGCVAGTIEHFFHGCKTKRRYIDRWSILIGNDFNPDEDLSRNIDGVLELHTNKPRLRRDIARYFSQRDEDANTLSGI